MHIHYFQHVAFESPAYIATWLTAQGHTLSATCFFEDHYTLPAIDDIDALVIMGGPMSVYDDHRYPWLQEEKAFIEDAIQAGKKVLGICLGAQLTALCLGAFVPTALHREIGWYPVFPADEAIKAAPYIHGLLAAAPTVFHWHGDKFDIPYGAYELAFSEANRNQGFVYKDHVLGLQFHAELTPADVRQMMEHGRHELRSGAHIQDEATLLAGITHTQDANVLMASILDRFFNGSL